MLRIRKTRWKVAYFAAFFVVANVVTAVLWPIIPLWAVSLTGTLLTLLLSSLLSSLIPLAIGALFLNSSIRLVRDPPAIVPEPAPLPKWKPIKP